MESPVFCVQASYMVVAFLVYENAATICRGGGGGGSGTPLDRANQVRIALDGHFVGYGKRFPVGLDFTTHHSFQLPRLPC